MIRNLKTVFSCLILLFLISCIKEVEIPKGILSKEQMSKSMESLLIAEDVTRLKGFQKDSSTKLFLGHYKPYELNKLGFTVAQFDSSYNFYIQYPYMFEEIMDSTQNSLKRKVEVLENIKKEKTK